MKAQAVVRAALAPAVVVLGCSTSPGSYDFQSLGVTVTRADGQTTEVGCTYLPVLLGSQVLNEFDVGGGLVVAVQASNREVTVRFEGVQQAERFTQTYRAEELKGEFDQELEVETLAGDTLIVTLSAGCSP